MQTISFDRSGRAQTALVSLLTLAALALLGLVLAYWTWVWLAPRPEPRAPVAVSSSESVGAARGLFGSAQPGGTVAAPTGMAIRLLGIVAAVDGGQGYAAVQLGGKEILAVREGEAVAPGIRMVEVATRHVILERGGIRETLALPRMAPGDGASANTDPNANPGPAAPVTPPAP